MILSEKLEGKNFYLKSLTLDYCKQYYVDWLNDTSINMYIEPRLYKQTIEGVTSYVKTLMNSPNGYLFGIFYKDKHIGNIQLSDIHPIYKSGKIGYFIGDKSCYGKGIITEAIHLVLKFAFEKLNVHRIEAFVFEEHIASQKALGKNGFRKEATFVNKVCIREGGPWCNYCVFAILQDEWVKLQS